MIGRRFRQRFSECSEVYLRAWRSSHLGVPRITCLAVLLEHLLSSTEFVLAYGLNRARVVFRVLLPAVNVCEGVIVARVQLHSPAERV